MSTDHRAKLANIRTFPQLVAYLRDEMNWPIEDGGAFEDLTFDYLPEELGIDPKTAAKIQEIKRLRPLSPKQPWGIFFVKFEPKRLPVVALRRILGQVALKKRASANSAERAAWAADDLLFVSNYGEGEERQISFAHFARAQDGHDLPTLKVLGWDNRDTVLHLDAVARELTEHLAWPDDDRDAEAWRAHWSAAFTLGHREVVTTSKQLSIRLAGLARNIRDRIKTALAIETDKGPLTRLMKAFQEALVHDIDSDGFADMYAQTIAYGLLSARIAAPHRKTADDFAAHMRTNPFLRELMETFLKVGGRRGKAGGPGIDFDELGVSEVVELLDAANMEAVVRDFGDRNPQEDPVIHFYELFLKEYDAKKRMQRGVFYTPRPVVSYIVRSVDELLRTEFGLTDGLADTTSWREMAKRHKDLKIPEGVSPDQDFVQILDPATGTGTFLVEVIDLIHKTLVAKSKAQGHGEKKIDALWNEYVPKHLLTRLHGYELLMAPYAIAHLKIGLKLYETGYRFGSDERARVYLTNALEPAQDFSGRFDFAVPALAHEAEAVAAIKRNQLFTAVIGNPPYSQMSQNLNEGARLLVAPYRSCDGEKISERGAIAFERNIQDDYIKFLRLGEIAIEAVRVGIAGLITNHAYLSNITLRGVRAHLRESFSTVLVLDLHGNSKVNEQPPEGVSDQNVFDIQQGVAISLLARMAAAARPALVATADLWGTRADKYRVLADPGWKPHFQTLHPRAPQYLFRQQDDTLADEYQAFVSLTELLPVFGSAITTARDHVVVDFEDVPLIRRLKLFQDRSLSDIDLLGDLGISESAIWKVAQARAALKGVELAATIVDVDYRPFDRRRLSYHNALVSSPRHPTMDHMSEKGSIALAVCRQQGVPGFRHVFVSKHRFDEGLVSNRSREKTACFPLWLHEDSGLFLRGQTRPNVSVSAALKLARWEGAEWRPDEREAIEQLSPRAVFNYIYAVLSSPGYRTRYEAFLQKDFPRVPSAGTSQLFHELAALGRALVALHLLESPKLDRTITEYLGGRAPEVEKVSWSKSTVWLDKAQTTGFKGVREEVWNFHIGGYQVCEKWLKDRKGRTLSKNDIAHYQKIVVALSETIRLMKEIDEVIEQHGGWPGAFRGSARTTEVDESMLNVAETKREYRTKN